MNIMNILQVKNWHEENHIPILWTLVLNSGSLCSGHWVSNRVSIILFLNISQETFKIMKIILFITFYHFFFIEYNIYKCICNPPMIIQQQAQVMDLILIYDRYLKNVQYKIYL